MNEKYISLSKVVPPDSLQKIQDEFSEQFNVGIALLDPELNFITKISNPYAITFKNKKDDCFSDIFFHVEEKFRFQNELFTEPLFSSYLTGKISRTIVPLHVKDVTVGAACFVHVHPRLTPIQLYGHLKLAVSSSKPLLKYLLDSYPGIPDIQFTEKIENFCNVVKSVVEGAKLESLLESMPAETETDTADPSLLIFFDPSGEIVHTTNTLSKLLGYENRDAIKGQSISSLLTFESVGEEVVEDVSEIDQQKIHSIKLKHKSGKELYGDLQFSSYKPADPDSSALFYRAKIEPVETPEKVEVNADNIQNIFGESRSQTESAPEIDEEDEEADIVNLATAYVPQKKIAENSLADFASILNTYPKPLLVIDDLDHLCLWNERAEQLFQISILKLDELSFPDFIDTDFISPWNTSLARFRSNQASETSPDYYLQCINGAGIHFSARLDLYKSQIGGVEYITITIREVRERIAGCEYLLSSRQSSNAGMLTTNSEGIILSANSEALEMLGTTTVCEDMGSFSELFDRRGKHDVNNTIVKLLKQDNGELTANLAGHTDNDHPLFLKAQKLHNPESTNFNILWLISSFQGVANGQGENVSGDVNASKDAPDDLYKMLSELFANMSSRLFKDLYVLEDQLYLEPDQEKRFNRIKQIAGRASELGELFVYFSKKSAPNIENHDFNKLLETYYSAVKTQFKTPIKLIFDDIPHISADEGDFWFILNALLKNADEACDERGKISISTFTKMSGPESSVLHHMDNGQLYVACQISDNGRGIPPEIQKNLFSLFCTNKTDELGRGLSLACVKAIIERYDGLIDVASNSESGTKVTLYFPALNSVEHIEEPELDPNKPTILALDDDPAIIDIYSSSLGREGFNVLCASTGAEAVRLMQEHKDKIVLSIVDISLPDSHLVKCPMALGEIKPDIYYIIATGFENDGSFDNANNRLRTVWLKKPFNETELVGHVKRLAYTY